MAKFIASRVLLGCSGLEEVVDKSAADDLSFSLIT
jgi:hypothetical protein